MTHKVLKLLAGRSEKITTIAGVALMAAAISVTGALHTSTARAESITADTISSSAPTPVLPPVRVLAAADTTASDAAPEGLRAKMRDRIRERVEERKKEFEKEHPPIDKKLSHDQVRDIVAGRLAMSGNPNLKVGKVSAKEDGIVSVEVLTKTGALADTRDISTKTGLPVGVEERMKDRAHGRRFAGEHGMRDQFRHGAFAESRSGKKPRRDLALTTEQAKKLAEARLIMTGNKNLRVGAVKEKDADTISIDIVASDNSLVIQRFINRHTGRPVRDS